MTRDEVLHLIQRRTDALNRHDVAALGELYAPDCVVHSPMAAGTVRGRPAVRKVYDTLFGGFPDLTFTVEHIVVDGGKVAVSGVLTGTSTGGFMGLPTSGKAIRVPVMTMGVVADGLIMEELRVYDFTGLLMQAGVLKAKPA
jgi:steroid delta-isomerase-like uncharacterized protein